MSVSVIVPTFNGAHKLPNVLQSLLNQGFQDFELIVSIDGSTDNTTEVLQTWLPKFKNARSIFHQNSGRSKTRNSGAINATADLLIFIDDDMRLEPDCLELHIHHHGKFPGSLVSGAQVYDEKKAMDDFQRYKSLISRNWYKPIEKIYPQPLPLSQLHLTAANFSVSKKVFEELGMFDESVTDMEDFLLAYKTVQKGIPVYYLHAAFGWHDDFADIYSMQERYNQYRKTAKGVILRFPEIGKTHPRYSQTLLTFIKKLGYTLLTRRLLVRLINNNKTIPEPLRYALYGAVIHAKANTLS